MAEAEKDQAGVDSDTKKHIAEVVRSRLTQLQSRLDKLETDARVRVSRVLASGDAKLRKLDRSLARVSREDWTVPGVRRQLEGLRARAETARAKALQRVAEMPGAAVVALASGTRAPIRTLTNRLADIARRIEKPRNEAVAEEQKARKAG